MDPKHEAAFDRLTQDLDPYHEFLRFDHVSAEVADPKVWRDEIRLQARRDKIRMRSFVLGRTSTGLYRVWAGKQRGYDLEGLRRLMEVGSVQREAAERAALHGHTIRRWLRVRDDEAAARCESCGGRLYVDASQHPPLISGDLFEAECV